MRTFYKSFSISPLTLIYSITLLANFVQAENIRSAQQEDGFG